MTRQGDIRKRLLEHLSDEDATMNDSTTEELYREWHRIPKDEDTDLEAVEAWVQRIANS